MGCFILSPGLGNFLSVQIDDEAVSETYLVRGAIVQRDAGHERGLKPAAMLVGCFEIGIGRIPQFRMRGANGPMGDSAIDPNVDGIVAFGSPFRKSKLRC